MNLDDFIVRSLEPGPPDPESEAFVAAGGEAAALAPELARTRDLLADEGTWADAPSSLEAAIVASISAEAAAGGVGAPVAHRPSDDAPVAGHRPTKARNRWWSVVPAAAAAVLVVGVVASSVGDTDGPPTVEVALAGTEAAPTANATAELQEVGAGLRVELDVEDLPPAEEGTYYQAWIVGPHGAVALGTFHLRTDRSPDIVLWSGVAAPRGVLVTVTLEPDDGDPAPSGTRVLEGRVAVGDEPSPTSGTAPPG